jgi:tocopherol O-methyltransferase
MILPDEPVAVSAVADHYDELDAFYREVWGEHVHHGLWHTGRESAPAAAVALVDHVAARLALGPAPRVVDIGAGYGATSRHLADRYGASVTALTVSPAQHAFATARPAGPRPPRYLLRDWLRNDLEAGAFDAAVAIESTEHMADKAGAFREAHRVLRPGGRFALCAWIARTAARPWEVRHLLEPICREGRLPGMGTEDDYRALLAGAGLEVTGVEDLSARVKGTWPRCARAVAARLATDARYRRFLASAGSRNRVFAATMLRIWAAYETGAMRYLLFTARRPDAAPGAAPATASRVAPPSRLANSSTARGSPLSPSQKRARDRTAGSRFVRATSSSGATPSPLGNCESANTACVLMSSSSPSCPSRPSASNGSALPYVFAAA